MSKKHSTYKSPSDLFSDASLEDVAEKLAKLRFRRDLAAPNIPVSNNSSSARNGAVVKLYNSTDNTMPVFFEGALSENDRFTNGPRVGKSNPRGHSERVLMANALDALIPTSMHHALPPPSKRVRSTRDVDQERRETVYNYASDYKGFLDGRGYNLNLVSELPVCGSEDGNCSTFLGAIAPRNSNIYHAARPEAHSGEFPQVSNRVDNYLGDMNKAYGNFLTKRNPLTTPAITPKKTRVILKRLEESGSFSNTNFSSSSTSPDNYVDNPILDLINNEYEEEIKVKEMNQNETKELYDKFPMLNSWRKMDGNGLSKDDVEEIFYIFPDIKDKWYEKNNKRKLSKSPEEEKREKKKTRPMTRDEETAVILKFFPHYDDWYK